MAMTFDEKQKCSEIYKFLTRKDVPPNQWNETAANKLSEIVAALFKCTQLIHLIPRGPGNDWIWLVTEAYGVIKRKFSNNPREVYDMCLKTGVWYRIREVEIALIGG
ncbi:MAG: hypothetical protein GY699_05400 [Desulfobacteraceae bacterium]|nr:hypothetical protein [Desulfobacteraceae bacterium]